MKDKISRKADSDFNYKDATKDSQEDFKIDPFNYFKQQESNIGLLDNRPDQSYVPVLNSNTNFSYGVSSKNIEVNKINFQSMDSKLIEIRTDQPQKSFSLAKPMKIIDLTGNDSSINTVFDFNNLPEKNIRQANFDYHKNVFSNSKSEYEKEKELLNSISDPIMKILYQRIEDFQRENQVWRRENQYNQTKINREISSLNSKITVLTESLENVKLRVRRIGSSLKFMEVKLDSFISSYTNKCCYIDKKLSEYLDEFREKYEESINKNNPNENSFVPNNRELLIKLILDIISSELKPKLDELMSITSEALTEINLIKEDQKTSNLNISSNKNYLQNFEKYCLDNESKFNQEILQIKRDIAYYRQNLEIVDQAVFPVKSNISDYKQLKQDFSDSKRERQSIVKRLTDLERVLEALALRREPFVWNKICLSKNF